MAEEKADGLRVLVTGASSGLGAAVVRRFSASGSHVAALARREAALDELAESGERVVSIVADVSDAAAAEDAVRRADATLGGLDVVVNAAGIAPSARLENLDSSAWTEVIDTNLSGAFYVSRASGLLMKSRQSGSIVNVASDLASMGAPDLVHYSASKAGVAGMSRALAAELAPYVRVNAISPGPIDTPMMRNGLDNSPDPKLALEDKLASVPLARFAEADEISHVIEFLAVHATFATGANWAVDGGTSAV
ncbi:MULTISPECIES: SDR family NAD(P)-dependent oxidoreductase [Brevibacterium]|uniref:SDR family NAD(P)-dependent oxidoreductase n=1 Tax=Brevibacterium TaxID=1696 RepID=UPI002006F634|nr:SDR family NAD(P)-dependent oxidoreductase [Brevibacterium sediminis]